MKKSEKKYITIIKEKRGKDKKRTKPIPAPQAPHLPEKLDFYYALWVSANKLGFSPEKHGDSFEILVENTNKERLQIWIDLYYPEENININNSSVLMIHNDII